MNRREVLKMTAMMLGGSLSPSVSSAVAAGVSSTEKPRNNFIDGEKRQSLQILAEMIIPQTDTPGAIEAGVPEFIELMVSDWYTASEREMFIRGLLELQSYCQTHFNESFNHCSSEEQTSALAWSEEISISISPGNTESSERAHFFHQIKELTVLGYYTSEVGAQQELIYKPLPMKYDGDIEFANLGRQWSS